MLTQRLGRNETCSCGSGKKFKLCCLRRSTSNPFQTAPLEKPRIAFGEGAQLRPMPRTRSSRSNSDNDPIKRIPVYYTYDEPFGIAECVYSFPVERSIVLASGNVVRAEWLVAGAQFRMEDGSIGTVTAVDPPKLWPPSSRIPDQNGNYARRILGTIKHKGYSAIDVTFGGQTFTGTPDHLWYSLSRKAWVPAETLQKGELLQSANGVVPVESVSTPQYGLIELFNMEVEELHTFFVGTTERGSGLVHNGKINYIKKPKVPTEADIVRGIRAKGSFNAVVKDEKTARGIMQKAMPGAKELPPAMAGAPYPKRPPGVKQFYQLHPPEPGVGNNLPHFKYGDWSGGKKRGGGSWGHIFFGI